LEEASLSPIYTHTQLLHKFPAFYFYIIRVFMEKIAFCVLMEKIKKVLTRFAVICPNYLTRSLKLIFSDFFPPTYSVI
jgi:hypothetical protein